MSIALSEYFHDHGDLDVPADYASSNGIELGAAVRNLHVTERLGEIDMM